MKLMLSIRLSRLWSVSSTFFLGALGCFFFDFFMKLYIVWSKKWLTEPKFCRKFIFSLFWAKRDPQGQTFKKMQPGKD